MKKPRRRRVKHNGKIRKRPAVELAENPQLCADFQVRYAKGEPVKVLSKELGIPMSTCYLWAKDIRRIAGDCLRARGWDEDKLIDAWIRQAKRSRGHVHNGALKEIGDILDVYPAKKPPLPPTAPVTVIFNTNIESYKGVQGASHTIEVGPGFPQQPQGNAGGGSPAGAITRSGLRDAEKSSGQAQA